jgi:hypothetical protein
VYSYEDLRLVVTDPSFEVGSIIEEDLRWYLEDFAPKYPYDITRANRVELDLTKYGQALVNSFQASTMEMRRLVVSS